MSNARRRRQTRTRRFDLPPERWPLNHNAAVHARKHAPRFPRLATVAAAIVAFGQMGAAFEEAARSIAEAVTSTTEALANWRAEQHRQYRRNELRRRCATLDRLAANGYDVREEMDALATEQAALELETSGSTQPEPEGAN